MEKTTFAAVTPKNPKPFSPSGLELVISYRESASSLPKRHAHARAQVERHLKGLEPEAKNPHFALHYTEGGKSVHLLIDPELDAFTLHTALRKAFAEIPSELWGMDIDLRIDSLQARDARRALEAVATLAAVKPWRPESFGQKSAEDKKKRPTAASIRVHSKLSADEVKALTERGLCIGEATNLVRTLADLPSNHLHPAEYRRRAQAYAKANDFKFEFWDVAALKKKGAHAFLAVVQADPDTKSGIAHLWKAPPNKKAKRKIALVGKGLCFDTGGYNIKVGGHMSGMHRDMTGSAVALALSDLVCREHPDAEVHVFMAIAENLISPTAFKADDVVIASNGKSIEIIDTDAEGRMVLCDTLAIASSYKPDLILDFATLTGAAIRALDTRRSAVFSNVPKLAAAAVSAGQESGERTWAFPIEEDDREQLKSKVADLLQCSLGNNCDHIYAASFLSEFVGEGIAWVHMDLAAAHNKGGLGLVETDTTGFGLRWALEFLRQN